MKNGIQLKIRISLAAGSGGGFSPDSGYVFVFLSDGRQLFLADGRAVQVPIEFANS